MAKIFKVGLAVLLIALLAISIGLNIFLYLQGRDYYIQLNSVRLDPLGLSVYAAQSQLESGERPIIIFFGDSRAADWTSPHGVAGTIINRGISNQTSTQAMGRFADDVLSLNPDVIVLQIGINDLKTIPLFPENKEEIIANLKTNVGQLIDLSGQRGARVILTTIFPVGRVPLERSMFWSGDVERAIKDVNQYLLSLTSDKVTVFDTAEILADVDGLVNPVYSRDFLHLNTAGYEALNRELVRIIQP